jgi:hypothetical protein
MSPTGPKEQFPNLYQTPLYVRVGLKKFVYVSIQQLVGVV